MNAKSPERSQARFSLGKCITLGPVFGFSTDGLSVQTSNVLATSKPELV